MTSEGVIHQCEWYRPKQLSAVFRRSCVGGREWKSAEGKSGFNLSDGDPEGNTVSSSAASLLCVRYRDATVGRLNSKRPSCDFQERKKTLVHETKPN